MQRFSLKKTISKVGKLTIGFFQGYGQLTIMAFEALWAFRKISQYSQQIVEQFIYIGRRSLPIVSLTSIFLGLALGVQIGTQMSASTPAWIEGGLILRSILLEMGPIIIGLILSGRVASGIASELGAMKVTEQIDALRVLAIDPVEYLVMPRMVAALIAIPVLLVFADAIGIFSGYLSSHFTIHLTWEGFIKGMRHVFDERDVYTSLIKALIFGQVIILFGSFFGVNSNRGAKGVGTATTHAVVWSSLEILALDYIISAILFFVW